MHFTLMTGLRFDVLAVVAMAGMLRGFSGFGFSLAAVPLLALFLPLDVAVPLSLLMEAVGILPALTRTWQHVDFTVLRRLLVGTAVGMPLGLSILHFGTPALLRPVIALAVLVSVAVLWHPPRFTAARPSVAFLAGMTSGVLNGAVAMSGPPIILFMLSANRPISVSRSTMMMFFSASAALTLIVGLSTSTYTLPELPSILWCLPALAIGVEAGIFAARSASPDAARRIALLALAAGALIALFTSIISLTSVTSQ